MSFEWPVSRLYVLYEVYEHSSNVQPQPVLAEKPVIFEDMSHLLNHRHHEEPYDDFARQSLLPARLSQLGPGVAWGGIRPGGWLCSLGKASSPPHSSAAGHL